MLRTITDAVRSEGKFTHIIHGIFAQRQILLISLYNSGTQRVTSRSLKAIGSLLRLITVAVRSAAHGSCIECLHRNKRPDAMSLEFVNAKDFTIQMTYIGDNQPELFQIAHVWVYALAYR